tara:strand:- start:107 stop:703 length:597 start_codon:yes stop_codon:yes gene_type:complete
MSEVIFFEAFVVLGFHAFEDYRTLPCAVVHQLMPRFSCGHSEQSYDSIMEVLEVSMNADRVLHLYSSEDLNAQNRVNEQDQEEKTSNIGELLNSSDESLQKNSQTLILLNDFEYSHNSERLNDGCQMSKLKPIYVLGSRSNPSSQHNDEVESVPAILEEVRTETNKFDGRLNGVDDVEDQIDILKITLKLRWFVVPCQ